MSKILNFLDDFNTVSDRFTITYFYGYFFRERYASYGFERHRDVVQFSSFCLDRTPNSVWSSLFKLHFYVLLPYCNVFGGGLKNVGCLFQHVIPAIVIYSFSKSPYCIRPTLNLFVGPVNIKMKFKPPPIVLKIVT